MNFQYPEFFWLFLVLPILLLFFIRANRRFDKLRAGFGSWDILQKWVPHYDPNKNKIKFYVAFAALFLLIIAMANPRIGSITQRAKSNQVEVVLALDISRSMWVKDVKPKGIDRMEKARLLALQLVKKLPASKLGLIIFAGDAYVQMPLTKDNAVVQLFLSEDFGNLSIVQGAAFQQAIQLAAQMGTKKDLEFEKVHRALVLISDGEDHMNDGITAAQNARNSGLRVFTMGVGSSEGGQIPNQKELEIYENGLDYYYEDPPEVKEFHEDMQGNRVISKADKNNMKAIANAGKGVFVDSEGNSAAVDQMVAEIQKLARTTFDTDSYNEYATYFQYLVWMALGLLVFEYILGYRKG